MQRTILMFILAGLMVGCGASSSGGNRTGTETKASVVRAKFEEGKVVFNERCAVCHGDQADGEGPMAKTISPPKPADFRREEYATMPVDSIRAVVVKGGAALGRNPRMPAWGEELSDEEIEAVVAFVRSVGRFRQMPTRRQVRTSEWFTD